MQLATACYSVQWKQPAIFHAVVVVCGGGTVLSCCYERGCWRLFFVLLGASGMAAWWHGALQQTGWGAGKQS